MSVTITTLLLGVNNCELPAGTEAHRSDAQNVRFESEAELGRSLWYSSAPPYNKVYFVEKITQFGAL
jgi:hypothetical protein